MAEVTGLGEGELGCNVGPMEACGAPTPASPLNGFNLSTGAVPIKGSTTCSLAEWAF